MKGCFSIAAIMLVLTSRLHATDADNLILAWSFDEAVGNRFADLSGNDRDGFAYDIAPGQVVLQQKGEAGAAVSLEGSGRNFIKNDRVDFTVYPGGDFTLDMWVKDPKAGSNSKDKLGGILAMQRSNTSIAWSLGLRDDGSLRLFTNTAGEPAWHDTSHISWEKGVWHHVVLRCRSHDEAGDYSIEVRKAEKVVLQDRFKAPAPKMENAGTFVVGGDNASTSLDRNLTGWIDEVRYLRTASQESPEKNHNQAD